MPKEDFRPTFDPYAALMELNQRLNRLEQAHNALAHDYRLSQVELSVTIEELNNLQKAHLKLSEFVISNYNMANHIMKD